MMLPKLSVIFVICALWFHVECMVVKFERAKIIYLDEDYMFNTTVFVRRYSRKSPHYLHIIANTRHLWNNNVSVDIIFDQYLHNEYRPSFVELHHKFCDFINDEPWAGGMLKMFGMTCPLHPGLQVLRNMTPPTQNFPNVFPFEKGRANTSLCLTATKKTFFVFHVELSFKQ